MTIAEANEPFASGLKIIIANKGLKNVHIAHKAGLTAQELSDMINGRRIIKACDVLKLSQAMKVNVDDIYMIGKGRFDYE